MMTAKITRRTLVGSAAALVPGVAAARYVSAQDGFGYEVTRSAEEWRAMLGEHAYAILSDGRTEEPKSHPLWDSTAAGTYACRGCALPVYDARWKVVLDRGWMFFRNGEPNALLMGIDWPDGSDMSEDFESLAAIEVHCRRCGGHMGHIFYVENQLLHSINGASMDFTAAA
jgi:peptide-methionine (R)-S-oxide reductase